MNTITRITRACTLETLNNTLKAVIHDHGVKYGLDDQDTASNAVLPDQGLNITGRYTDKNKAGITFSGQQRRRWAKVSTSFGAGN